MELPSPSPIHKIFVYYIFLNEINEHSEGISGYKLKKVMNKLIKDRINARHEDVPDTFSQSLVYRVFKSLKIEGLINGKRIIIKNRTQILYSINDKGKKRLEYLRKIIQNFAPTKMDPKNFIEDLFAGKISPLEFLPKHLPKEQLLETLKAIRRRIEKVLTDINAKIEEIETESVKK